jgi:hypothetical protein
MRIAGRWSAWPAMGLAAYAVLISSGGLAQSPQPLSPPQFQGGGPPPGAMPPPGPAGVERMPPMPQGPGTGPGTGPGPGPASGPNLIDTFTRWMQDSTAGLNPATWGNATGKPDAAGNAPSTPADVAKGAADATLGAAGAVTNAARETAGALSRLPASRVAAGRERCGVAPNGAPDCRAAAEKLCRSKGFGAGSSIDFETAEVCPSSATLARWRGESVKCGVENFVTRALCQ